MFENFTGEDSADEWGMAAAIFIAQHRRRHSGGPTFRELFEHLLPDSHGLPTPLPREWDIVERRRASSDFRLHSAIEWRRRGYIGFDKGIKHSLRVGRAFRERSRRLRANTTLTHPVTSLGIDTGAASGSGLVPLALADLTADEVMARLQITPRYLTRLTDGGFLHVVVDGAERRFPGWQFNYRRRRSIVPGIRELAPAIPADWSLRSIRDFMSTPRGDLRIRGGARSPIEWLLDGGDPAVVATILRDGPS